MMDEDDRKLMVLWMSMAWRQCLVCRLIPISAAKNEGVDELVRHALHIAKYQERPVKAGFL